MPIPDEFRVKKPASRKAKPADKAEKTDKADQKAEKKAAE
jgi:hypothetical protein